MNTPLVAVKPKLAILSKRFWLNALAGLTALQEVIPQIETVVDIPDSWVKYIFTAVAIGNILLLRTSDQPVRFRRESVEDGVAVPSA
jgi:hypothetical protein